MKPFFTKRGVKIFLVVFLFILSIYTATFIHEVGHVISFYSLGCDLPGLVVRIDITGGAGCLSPENWHSSLTILEDLIATGASLVFVSLLGFIFLIGFKLFKFVKKNYILSIIFFSLAFNCFLNGFLQSISGNDISEILSFGVNPLYTNLFAGLVGILLIYTTSQFGNLLKRVEPKIKSRTLKILSVLFWVLAILIVFVYLFTSGYFLASNMF